MPKKKVITAAEGLKIIGKAAIKAGEKLEDDSTPNVITLEEWTDILQSAAVDAWNEYND